MKLIKSKAKSRLTNSNLKNYLLLIALSKKNYLHYINKTGEIEASSERNSLKSK